MHMADALISPAVGGAAWAATAATTVYCARKVRTDADPAKVPLMGVLGAFVFAAQMINFQIPGTGSSGHIGGGLLLAILLGPEAAFLVIASVLTVQSLFFADGGLLALGCNIFNLGVFPAFVAYPMIFKRNVGTRWSTPRIVVASVVAGVVGLELGALGVALQTAMSGISSLPFSTFSVLMLAIHLAIGVVEGVVTAAVVLFVRQAQPELLARASEDRSVGGLRLGPMMAGFLVAALVLGGGLSYFASTDPDGLEWSIARVTGSDELAAESAGVLHNAALRFQEKTALFPDYEAKAPAQADDRTRASDGVTGGSPIATLVGLAVTAVVFVVAIRFARRRGSADPNAARRAR